MSSLHGTSPSGRTCGSISLPILTPAGDAASPTRDKRKVRKSKSGKWRAAVLIGVHLLFIIHLSLWFLSGMRDGVRETISPVEPSESMYTIESGLVNAGFIFFVLALLATLIFGRFFCGWGCHIVALQDLCGWIMKKCGVHPKPFRSRLLVFVPLIVALYMFVWPTFKREVLYERIVGPEKWVQNDYAVLFGEPPQFPGWSDHLIVEDFWKTFAPWYVAIPFIFVCTFGVVYFLGNKGFCTYGCPYGGFFGPLDLISPGKIKVNNNCEGCGHCTAVCTSNVRVHEEVRDFGMVMDPGCMKCMDCVSVCPNDALSFGFAKPTAFTKPRTPEIAQRRRERKRSFDFTWGGEILLGLTFLTLTLGFRGLLNEVPLLMALGLAGIGTFFAWKLTQLIREKNVRIHSFQLKLKSRLRPAAVAFIPLALITLLAALWGFSVKYSKWNGEMIATEVAKLVSPADLLQGKPVPQAAQAVAERALRAFERAGPIREGGFGWRHRPDELPTIGFLQLVLGRPLDTEKTMMEIMARGTPQDSLVLQLGNVMKLRGVPDDEVVARYAEILKLQPQLAQIRGVVATHYMRAGHQQQALQIFEDAIPRLPGDPTVRKDFGMLLGQIGQAERGIPYINEAAEIARGKEGMMVRRSPEALRQCAFAFMVIERPDLALPLIEELFALPEKEQPAGLHFTRANALFATGKHDEAFADMRRAIDIDPRNPHLPYQLAQMYNALGRGPEAQSWAQRAERVQRENEAMMQTPSPLKE